MQMSGNTILLTGGTSGIGLGLAKRFYAEANTVIIAGRREQLLADITAQHSGMDSVVLDVTDADATIINASSGLGFVALAMTPTYCATKAAIHSYTQSLRVQLTDTEVQVIELVPPGVQTELMGQDARGQGMQLEAFLTAVMDLLRNSPDAEEICVQEVLVMRNAEAEGRHHDVLAMMSGAH